MAKHACAKCGKPKALFRGWTCADCRKGDRKKADKKRQGKPSPRDPDNYTF